MLYLINGLKEMSFKSMFDYYKQKYNQKDVSIIKRGLVYFDEVTNNNWNAVKLLNDTLSIDTMKNTIIDEVNKYNKSIIGNV
ncbi:hypothetical protein FACS1894110_26440 [Spirochaetia bacterium]|nr:hypothetical protein FACS1894110_26440 [Spirochaetia bacterium]